MLSLLLLLPPCDEKTLGSQTFFSITETEPGIQGPLVEKETGMKSDACLKKENDSQDCLE